MGDKGQVKVVGEYDKKYVGVGEWVEEFPRNRSVISVFRNMRKKKKSSFQSGVSSLFNQLLEPVVLRSTDGRLRFGDSVQLMSDGQVLSIMVKDEDYSKYSSIPQGSFLTASDTTMPCVRNSFLIIDPWKKTEEGSTLRYGDDFAVSTSVAPGVPRLFVGADYPFCSLTLKPGHSSLRMFSHPGSQCRFRIESSLSPSLSEGSPVLPDRPFHILSSPSDRSLVVNKNCKVLSILGIEKEVSLYYTPDWFTKYDRNNLTNLWKVNSRDLAT